MAQNSLLRLNQIGNGSQGVVQKVRDERSGMILALKEIPMEERTRRQTLQEVQTLAQSCNPYVVTYYGGFFRDGKVSIVLEYMDGGSLADISRAIGRVQERYVGAMARMILEGLAYLHDDIHVIHRDIKPSNLLVSQQGIVKIADLGMCNVLAVLFSSSPSSSSCFLFQSQVRSVRLKERERVFGRATSTSASAVNFRLWQVLRAEWTTRWEFAEVGAALSHT